MRKYFFAVFIFCALLIGAALFLQFVMDLKPCPLCIVQRIVVISTGIVALLATLLTTSHGFLPRFWSFLLLLGGATSLGIASYHAWLISQPNATCSPKVEVMLDQFIEYLPQGSWTEALFRSTAACTDSAAFLGIQVPYLVLPVFLGFALFLLWLLFKRNDEYYY